MGSEEARARGEVNFGGPRARASALATEHVVPVFAGGTHSVEGGMEGPHGTGHGFAGRIEVKAAEDRLTLSDQIG